MNQTDILLKIAKDAFSISYIKWVRWSRLSNTILISFGRKDLYKDIGEHSNFIQNIWYFSLQNNSLWKKSHISNSKKYPKDNFFGNPATLNKSFNKPNKVHFNNKEEWHKTKQYCSGIFKLCDTKKKTTIR